MTRNRRRHERSACSCRVTMIRKSLLVCGILSSLLYIAMTIVIAAQWETYSSAAQTVSELSAIGAPTRSVWLLPAALYTVLVTAFGWGVWISGGRTRALRIAGALIVAYGALGLLWPRCTCVRPWPRVAAR
jgi:hypothetical protein